MKAAVLCDSLPERLWKAASGHGRTDLGQPRMLGSVSRNCISYHSPSVTRIVMLALMKWVLLVLWRVSLGECLADSPLEKVEVRKPAAGRPERHLSHCSSGRRSSGIRWMEYCWGPHGFRKNASLHISPGSHAVNNISVSKYASRKTSKARYERQSCLIQTQSDRSKPGQSSYVEFSQQSSF